MSAVEIYYLLSYIGRFISNWWWVPLPFLFWEKFKFFWLWWRTMENWMPKQKKILLEIRMPKEMLKPIRAMELVMASIHSITYHPPDWWEKWIDGQVWMTVDFEMVSTGGDPHFYIRAHRQYKDAIE